MVQLHLWLHSHLANTLLPTFTLSHWNQSIPPTSHPGSKTPTRKMMYKPARLAAPNGCTWLQLGFRGITSVATPGLPCFSKIRAPHSMMQARKAPAVACQCWKLRLTYHRKKRSHDAHNYHNYTLHRLHHIFLTQAIGGPHGSTKQSAVPQFDLHLWCGAFLEDNPPKSSDFRWHIQLVASFSWWIPILECKLSNKKKIIMV